jgi:multicomponent Na+:H+ antiporter subunit D
MGAGVVLETTGKSRLTELGGLGRAMPAGFWLYMVGAFSISGVPFFNGFISKSMVVSAAGEAHLPLAMLLLNLAGVGTFLSVGLKLPYFTWFSREPALTPSRAPRNMYVGMAVVSALCLGYGIFPSHLYRLLPFPVHFEPYSTAHLVETVQLLIFTLVAFWLLRKILKPKPLLLLDFDWFYRKPAGLARTVFLDVINEAFSRTDKALGLIVRKLAAVGKDPLMIFSRKAPVESYSPDRDRPATQNLILIVLVSFLLLVAVGMILFSI